MSGIPRPRGTLSSLFHTLATAFLSGIARLDKNVHPSHTLARLRNHKPRLADLVLILQFALALFWFTIMRVPSFPFKLIIPIAWFIILLIPLTSQFFLPATPVLMYLLSFYSSRFIPEPWRPPISVALLPTLEYVLYGANISDILTRFTHPVLDLLAWFPYGVGHFVFPFFVAAFLWLFRGSPTLRFFGTAFGFMNFAGVLFQILFPCSAPWYELIHGLTPANYSMKGSPGGLARIDKLFGGTGYTVTFSNSPVVFGAFPSLHAANATIEALFLSHFFPKTTRYAWGYAAVLYWATMYLTHHYLIDVVGGACLATAFFYLFLPEELKGAGALAKPGSLPGSGAGRSKYEVYDLEDPRRRGPVLDAADFEISEGEMSEDEDTALGPAAYRSPITSSHPPPSLSHNGSSSTPSSNTSINAYREAKPNLPKLNNIKPQKKAHRHTASIASLIRGEERSPEDGWSPVRAEFVDVSSGGINGHSSNAGGV